MTSCLRHILQKLIEVVRNFPVLWKTDHVDYRKRGPRNAVTSLIESDRGELEFSSVFKVAECYLVYFYAHGLPMSSVWLYRKTLHFTAMATMEHVTGPYLSIWRTYARYNHGL